MKRNVNTLIKYLFDRSGIRLYLSFLLDDRGATNTSNQIAAGKLTLGNQLITNLQQLFSNYNVSLIMWNSIKISVITVLFSLLITSLAAFGFEKFRTRSSEMIYSLFYCA